VRKRRRRKVKRQVTSVRWKEDRLFVPRIGIKVARTVLSPLVEKRMELWRWWPEVGGNDDEVF